MPFWKERALWWPEPRGLIVAGVDRHRAGATPSARARRACTPCAARCRRTQLQPFLPEHLLVGHGAPLHGSEAAAALLDALDRSRRDIPTFVSSCRA